MNTGWLKLWIGIGTVAAAVLLVFPPYLTFVASKDVQRYRECVGGTRSDCKRSIVWNLVDVAVLMGQQDGEGDLFSDPYDRPSGSLRTSETSPFIEKVEPKGMANANGIYTASANKNVTFRTSVTGLVTTVDLYQLAVSSEDEIARPVKVSAFKKGSDGIWQTTYAMPPGFNGSMEIRAYGKDPKDMAALTLPVAIN